MPLLFSPPAPPRISPLSLHDALPISGPSGTWAWTGTGAPSSSTRSTRSRPGAATMATTSRPRTQGCSGPSPRRPPPDRKSTRLNSSHLGISYAVFCLKKKNNQRNHKELVEKSDERARARTVNVDLPAVTHAEALLAQTAADVYDALSRLQRPPMA